MSNINFDEHKKRLEDYRTHRDLEFNVFLEDHAERNPPPKKPEIKKRRVSYSLKFWLAIIAGICAVGASGLRVYDRIYQVAINSGANPTIAAFESWFALGAVNIGLVALAFTFAYVKKKVSNTSLFIGLLVAGIISLVAGLGQSFYGLRMNETGLSWVTDSFDWILAITLAAITGLEWVSGDMAGVELVVYEQQREKAEDEYRRELKLENDRYEREYKEWLKISRQQFGNWKMQFSNWQERSYGNSYSADVPDFSKKKTTQFRKQPGRTTDEQETRLETVSFQETSKEFILETIKELYEETGETPSTTEICRTMVDKEFPNEQGNLDFTNEYIKSKKGYVSKIRKQWMETN